MFQHATRLNSRFVARSVSAIALAAALTMPNVACAEASEEAGASSDGIQEITVIARKRAESAQTVPLAITAVSGETLATNVVQQVADVKALVPSITMQADSYTSFGVRIGIRGIHTNDTLLQSQTAIGIYMDGVYVANSAGLLLGNLADVSQMEVLKGPQGTLFGRNSTGGAMLISTNLPSYDGISNDVKLGVGNFGRFEASDTLNLPLVADKAALRVTGQFVNDNGYGTQLVGLGSGPFAPKKMNDQRTYSFRAALRLDPTEQLNIVLRGDYSHGESHNKMNKLVFANPAGAEALATLVTLGLWNAPSSSAPSGTPNTAALTAAGLTPATAFPYAANLLLSQQPSDFHTMIGDIYIPGFIKEYGVSGTIAYDLSDDTSIKSITAYRHMNYFAGQDSDSTSYRLLNSEVQKQALNAFSQELTLNGKAAGGALDWTLGGYYYHQVGEDQQTYSALSSINPRVFNTQGKFTQETYAFYGQGTFAVTDQLRLTAGLRWTHESQVLFNKSSVAIPAFGITTCDSGGTAPNCGAKLPAQSASNLSYTFSADYRVTPDIMIYARTGRAYRGGGTNERGGALVGQTFLPEQATDYEIGIKSYLLDRKARVNLAAYQTEYKNIQRTVIVAGPSGAPTSIISNAASARIKGFEADVLLQPVDGLSFTFGAAYTDAKYLKYVNNGVDLSGLSFQGVPKWSWNASASYAIPVGNAVVRPSINYDYRSAVNFQTDSNTVIGGVNTRTYTTQEGYGLLNGRIAYELDEGGTTISLWVKNLTNKKYITNALDVAQSLGLITNAPGAPRTFGMQFSHKF